MTTVPLSLLKITSKSQQIVGSVDGDLRIPLLGALDTEPSQWTTVDNFVTGGVASDHGGLTGLGDDDHPQYHNGSRADAWLGNKTSDNIAEGTTNLYLTPAEKTEALAGPNDRPETVSPPLTAKVEIELTNGTMQSTTLDNLPGGGGGGVTDHGQLTGLGNDDHVQYHTSARATAWLGTQTSDVLPEGTTNLYMTPAEKAEALANPNDQIETPSPPLDAKVEIQLVSGDLQSTQLSNLPGGGGGVTDHGSLTGLADDDHLQYHTDARALTWVAGIGLSDTGITDGEIKSAYEANANTNAFTDVEKNFVAALPFDDAGEINQVVTVQNTFGFLFTDAEQDAYAYIGDHPDLGGLAIWTDDPTGASPVDEPGIIDLHGSSILLSMDNTTLFKAEGAFARARLELGDSITLTDGRVVHPLTFVQAPPQSNVQNDTDAGPIGPLTNNDVAEILSSSISITSNYDYTTGARYQWGATVNNATIRTGIIYIRFLVNGAPGSWQPFTVVAGGDQPWAFGGNMGVLPQTGDTITVEFYADGGNHNQFSCDITDMKLTIEQPGEGDTPVSHSGLTNLDADDHTQYHNDARASVWFTSETLGNLASLDAGGKNITNVGTVGGANMSNVPSATEKAALPGAQTTASAPSGTNFYTTDDDTRFGHEAAVDPTANDDDTATPPFGPNSRWLNTLSRKAFVCVSAATGAADWLELTGGGGPVGPPELLGTALMPPDLGMGQSFTTTATVVGATVANHFILGVQIPGGLKDVSWYGAITAGDTATVTLTNNSTMNLTGLSGNMTVIARAIS